MFNKRVLLTLKYSAFVLFVFSFFLHTKCKKIEPIGKGYVLTTGLCIHKEPSYRSECQEKLERGNIIKILEYKIKDKDPKYNLYWYHVLSDKSNGYISLDEEISRGNFGTILSYNGGTLYVNASALRVRSLPSLTGEIIENLPNGTAVSVVGTTPFKIKIDDKYDN
ncbi:SH3 domain protein [Leptospira interrogans serovar Valbuzzi str. Duyster]|uniref:SH3 domain-containing protein n=1 Tax=Leptospira interrogans TaxID=173 RepID=UPI0002BB1254|nr:SH3 domain-containing protein [Leptospira interrogans]EMJ59328.1 SH3 domain protein [Leptospira interrogans serovar Valbuzzi str. Duyster]ENO71172.1 SH3 domain protein [Leptospira interrogans serovar Valbuzzi str. Valbuzzi]